MSAHLPQDSSLTGPWFVLAISFLVIFLQFCKKLFEKKLGKPVFFPAKNVTFPKLNIEIHRAYFIIIIIIIIIGHISVNVATLALGSRPRQRELQGCGPKGSPGVKPRGSPGVKAKGSPGSHITYSRECKKVLGSVRKC